MTNRFSETLTIFRQKPASVGHNSGLISTFCLPSANWREFITSTNTGSRLIDLYYRWHIFTRNPLPHYQCSNVTAAIVKWRLSKRERYTHVFVFAMLFRMIFKCWLKYIFKIKYCWLNLNFYTELSRCVSVMVLDVMLSGFRCLLFYCYGEI